RRDPVPATMAPFAGGFAQARHGRADATRRVPASIAPEERPIHRAANLAGLSSPWRKMRVYRCGSITPPPWEPLRESRGCTIVRLQLNQPARVWQLTGRRRNDQSAAAALHARSWRLVF